MLINNLFKKSIISALSRIKFSYLKKLSGNNLLLPFYHLVNDNPPPHIRHLYSVRNVTQFKEDLEFFINNYSPIALSDILSNKKRNLQLPENSFLLTFDDGCREMYDVVMPILLEKGVPAVFFLTTEFLDNKELFYRHKASLLLDSIERAHSLNNCGISEVFKANRLEHADIKRSILTIRSPEKHVLDELAMVLGVDFDEYLRTNKPYLSSTHVKGLIEDGFEIGAHSIDHPDYQLISLKEQLWQTKTSTEIINESFSLDYTAFATPFTDEGIIAKYFDEIFNRLSVDISFGTSGMKRDSYMNSMQRVFMEGTDKSAVRIISESIVLMLIRSFLNRNTMERTV